MNILTSSIAMVVFISICAAEGSCPSLHLRSSWLAKSPKKSSVFPGKRSVVLIKEIGNYHCRYCNGKDYCWAEMSSLQKYDMQTYKEDDIMCNFAICENGDLFEGRGYHKSVVGNQAMVVCLIGDYHSKKDGNATFTTLENFLSCPDFESVMTSDYTVTTLRDVSPISVNPGIFMFNLVQTLPHYKAHSRKTQFDKLWRKGNQLHTG